MKTKENIIELTKISIQKGIAWLTENEDKIENVLDLSANYKALYLYAVTGMSDRAKKYVDLISKRYIQKDGDFRTLFNEKGWPHSPSTPANRYIYPNGWIIMGLQKAGAYGLAKKGLDFLDRFQDSELGGFYSRFNVEKEVVVKCYMDTSPTSSTGLALLSCGKYKKAIMAGNFILMVLNNQTDFEKHFFTAWEKEKGLITDVCKQDESSSLYGRKNFCVSSEEDARFEPVWYLGIIIKFLCKLYDLTLEERFLEGAIKAYDFFNKLGDGRWENASACKIMWGTAELYRHTKANKYKETSLKILEWILNGQYSSGIWRHTIFYKSIDDQPFAVTLDLVQEYISELNDVIFDLS